jgi:hypothetical protein
MHFEDIPAVVHLNVKKLDNFRKINSLINNGITTALEWEVKY